SRDVHFLFNTPPNMNYLDSYALYPTVNLRNCIGLTAMINGDANLVLNHCGVNFLTIGLKASLQGMIDLYNCQLRPKVDNSIELFYILPAKSGVSFTNCLFLSPEIEGTSRPELINNSGIIKINHTVRYNHLNSRICNSIRNYYKRKNIPLNNKFIGMLKNHSDLEQEQV